MITSYASIILGAIIGNIIMCGYKYWCLSYDTKKINKWIKEQSE